jgi:hypothetical protein
VGFVQHGSVSLPLAEGWNGTTWSVNATQAPVGVNRSNLSSVSCFSIVNCMSVGFYDAGEVEAGLGEQWN